MSMSTHCLGFSFADVVIVAFVVDEVNDGVDYRAIYHYIALKRENLPES